MPAVDYRLSFLPFPQRIDEGRIRLNLLAAPALDPLGPLAQGLDTFVDLALPIEIRLLPSLDALPAPGQGTALHTATLSPPAQARALFEAIAAHTPIVDPGPPAAPPRLRILKVATPAYLAAAGAAVLGSRHLVRQETYACAMRDALDPGQRPPPPARAGVTWNQLLARCLRQPLLARALGLVHQLEVAVQAPEGLAEGGFLWIEPAPGSPLAAAATADPDLLRVYAARLPRLGTDATRPVVAPVLFPVRAVPPGGGYDAIFAEAEAYADGFARIVHASQPHRHDPYDLGRVSGTPLPPTADAGIRLGWDDEQLLEWMNRQLTEDPRIAEATGTTTRDAPCGVLGWRIDVREIPPEADEEAIEALPWTSLVRAAGTLSYQGIELGSYDGELAIETLPGVLQRLPLGGGGYRDHAWLPADAARWSGGSLLGGDPLRAAFAGQAVAPPLPPVEVAAVTLRYGRIYEFRARLMDLTGGGPEPADQPATTNPRGIARLRYRRFAPPRDMLVDAPRHEPESRRVVVNHYRPVIGYPDALFLEGDIAARRAALLAQAQAPADPVTLPAVPDTDASRLRVDLWVGTPDGDPAAEPGQSPPRRRLLAAPLVRDFPDDPEEPLQLVFRFVDVDRLENLPPPAAEGEIVLPSSRDIFVEVTPIARLDPAMLHAGNEDPLLTGPLTRLEFSQPDPGLEYFGNQAARIGMTARFTLREPARNEAGLLAPAAARPPLAAILIAPPEPGTVAAVATRLATSLGLRQDGMTFSALPGRRTVIGCTPRLAHVASFDRGSVTLGSEAEITDRWIVAIALTLERDWSWDGLAPEGLAVWRRQEEGPEELAGHITVPMALSPEATLPGTEQARSTLLFLDVVEPEIEGAHPSERRLAYRVEPKLRTAATLQPPEEWHGTLRLPIARPPQDRPALVSAGIVQGPYIRDAHYASTARRHRLLWIEFAEPPANPSDIVCARAIAWAPDPALTSAFSPLLDGPDPALAVPDEPVRMIVPDQSDDRGGADAMQHLIATRSPRHFLVPLPPGVGESSNQLFGFFRYEFRFAHGPEVWSTARARFGPPLAVDGLRHPPPELECGTARFADRIAASAAAARPEGPDHPAERRRSTPTDLWFLLYGQVLQADGREMRNILLSRRRGHIPEAARDGISAFRPRAEWKLREVFARLDALALGTSTPLSVIAVEVLSPTAGFFPDPLAGDLGEVTILRSSPLVPVPTGCP